jgi:uncharacterized membrane protein HdeD (DUF308 family)
MIRNQKKTRAELNDARSDVRMQAFDAPMHGKHMNLREFSSKFDREALTEEKTDDDCHGGARRRGLVWRLLPVCGASALTIVFALRREATDWGPEAALLHYFIAMFLPLRMYARVCWERSSAERTQAGWLALALLAVVMLFAYPYDTATVAGAVFGAVLLCDGVYAARSARARPLAANALTLLVLSNALLSLMVYRHESPLAASWYHTSFASLCALLVSF